LDPVRVSTLRERWAMPLHLSTLEEYGFRVLAEDPPRELVIGAQAGCRKLHGDLDPLILLPFTNRFRREWLAPLGISL
jgi:hypothetical protein